MSKSELRVAAQIALLGEVPPSLRSVSLLIGERTLHFRAIFQTGAGDDDLESLRCVATEVLASLNSSFTVEEELICTDEKLNKIEYGLLVFRRKEAD